MSLGLDTAADVFGFLGTRGSDDFALNDRPGNFREQLLIEFPVGKIPLTGLTNMMESTPVDDPKFTWASEDLAAQKANFTAGNVFTDAGLSSAYSASGGGVENDVLYIKLTSATDTLTDLNHFRVGHQVVIGLSTNQDIFVNAEVLSVQKGTTTSTVSVRLIEDDNNAAAPTTANISDCDTMIIVGNINEEMSKFKNGISYDPEEFFNFTQIFTDPFKLSRTNKMTRARYEGSREKMFRQTMQYHAIGMEQAFMWGQRSKSTDSDTGLPKRSTRGIYKQIIEESPTENISSYKSDADFAGQTWKQGGQDWLNEKLEVLFRHGENVKTAVSGNAALLGISKLVDTNAHMNIVPLATQFGHRVNVWTTVFGTINILTHPLMTREPMFNKNMLVIEPEQIKYRYVTDTMFLEGSEFQTKGGGQWQDGEESGFLTEAGLEVHNFKRHGLLKDVGEDNTAS